MAITLKSIKREVVVRPPRMIIVGTEKVGKSSYAASSNAPIFIPIRLEEGIDALDVPKFPVCKTFQDILDCLEVLEKEKHDFETVVIDSASAAEPVIWQSVCDEANVTSIELVGGGYGKGYIEALSKWRELMDALDRLRDKKGMASIIIGHVKVKAFNDPERPSYDQYQFDINEKVSAALYRWADFIGFAHKAISVVEEKSGFNKKKIKAVDDEAHMLFTKKTPAHPGGGRGVFGRLPAELPLEWSEFENAVSEVIAEEQAEKKKTKK